MAISHLIIFSISFTVITSVCGLYIRSNESELPGAHARQLGLDDLSSLGSAAISSGTTIASSGLGGTATANGNTFANSGGLFKRYSPALSTSDVVSSLVKNAYSHILHAPPSGTGTMPSAQTQSSISANLFPGNSQNSLTSNTVPKSKTV